jgi:hypothetical protein
MGMSIPEYVIGAFLTLSVSRRLNTLRNAKLPSSVPDRTFGGHNLSYLSDAYRRDERNSINSVIRSRTGAW